jgi:hypothetical protein
LLCLDIYADMKILIEIGYFYKITFNIQYHAPLRQRKISPSVIVIIAVITCTVEGFVIVPNVISHRFVCPRPITNRIPLPVVFSLVSPSPLITIVEEASPLHLHVSHCPPLSRFCALSMYTPHWSPHIAQSACTPISCPVAPMQVVSLGCHRCCCHHHLRHWRLCCRAQRN